MVLCNSRYGKREDNMKSFTPQPVRGLLLFAAFVVGNVGWAEDRAGPDWVLETKNAG